MLSKSTFLFLFLGFFYFRSSKIVCSSLKYYIDDLDSSTEDEDFEGIDINDSSEIEESDIEGSINSEVDKSDDNIENSRDWCEIATSGQFRAISVLFYRHSRCNFFYKHKTPLDALEILLIPI